MLPGTLAYLGSGREELALDADGPARVLLLGGEPFGEELVMWWNVVGRSREELDASYATATTGSGRSTPRCRRASAVVEGLSMVLQPRCRTVPS